MIRPALLLSLVPLLLAAAPRKGGHPDAGKNPAADACETCHAEATPDAVKAWEGSTHGLLLVRCLVCHGSTGEDFARTPDPRRCAGCHADEVASVAPAKGRKAPAEGCFGCHAPHALSAEGKPNPHAR
jgi:hypothetical protein